MAKTAKEFDRATREDPQATLFEIEPDWRDQWWSMPSFEMGDARPSHRITMNFLTADDLAAFAKLTGIPVSTRSDSAWYPPQEKLNGGGRAGLFYYDGPKTDSRYPVCIPSKGRAQYQKVANALGRMGVTYRFFVEETEYDQYCAAVGESNVVKLPFHDLGQGSIPARNFIWDWAKERGHRRHWVVDDNITTFARCHRNRRLDVHGGAFFNAMEDFVDRYENIAMAGPHDKGFVSDRDPALTPFLLNSRVYSCILLDTLLTHRWRGKYNEDTDLSLRLLKDGYCTLLFRSLLMHKPATFGAKGKATPGGNTDHVYNTGDNRKAFAESLRDQHPDVVTVNWKFNRWHHQVDYSPFKRNRLKLRPGVTPTRHINDYGMSLMRRTAADPDPGPEPDNDNAEPDLQPEPDGDAAEPDPQPQPEDES